MGGGEDGFSGRVFRTFEVKCFWFVVEICDPMHDVEALFHLPLLLATTGNLF